MQVAVRVLREFVGADRRNRRALAAQGHGLHVAVAFLFDWRRLGRRVPLLEELLLEVLRKLFLYGSLRRDGPHLGRSEGVASRPEIVFESLVFARPRTLGVHALVDRTFEPKLVGQVRLHRVRRRGLNGPTCSPRGGGVS